MKKIYKKITEIKIAKFTPGFINITPRHHYCYCDSVDTKFTTQEFTDYDDLVEGVANGKIPNASVEYSDLKFNNIGMGCRYYRVGRRLFKKAIIRVWYEEVKSYSLQTLYENLPADEFLAYCVDHNVNFFQNLSKRG
jgi:hypothetical protein